MCVHSQDVFSPTTEAERPKAQPKQDRRVKAALKTAATRHEVTSQVGSFNNAITKVGFDGGYQQALEDVLAYVEGRDMDLSLTGKGAFKLLGALA